MTSCTFDYFSRDLISRLRMTSLIMCGFLLPFTIIIVFSILTKMKLTERSSNICKDLTGSSTAHSNSHYQSLLRRNCGGGGGGGPQTSVGPQTSMNMVSKSRMNASSATYSNSLRSGNSLHSTDSGSDRRSTVNNVLSQRKDFSSIINRESRVLKTILVNVSMFSLAWIPYAIVVLLAQYSSNVEYFLNPYTTSLPGVFAKISSVYNPVLYTLSNRECRLYFKSWFKRIC
jgi:hypothetical protein